MLEKVDKTLPLKPNMMSILYNKVELSQEKKIITGPYAFDHSAYIDTQRKRFREVKEKLLAYFDHLKKYHLEVVNLLGMLLEHDPFPSLFEPDNKRTFHTLCVSSEDLHGDKKRNLVNIKFMTLIVLRL